MSGFFLISNLTTLNKGVRFVDETTHFNAFHNSYPYVHNKNLVKRYATYTLGPYLRFSVNVPMKLILTEKFKYLDCTQI